MAGGQYAAVREYMGMAPKGGVRNDQLAAWDVLTAWVDKVCWMRWRRRHAAAQHAATHAYIFLCAQERVNNPDRKITNEDMQTEFGEEWEKVDWAKLTRKRTVPPALTATVTNASPAKKAKRAEEDVATEELNEQEVDLSDAINQLAKQVRLLSLLLCVVRYG